MFNENDEKYIKRHLGLNNLLLFVGAGFSLLAKNRLNENLPIGSGLSKKLWTFLELPGEWDGTPLQSLYELFIQRGVSKQKKIDFLYSHLYAEDIPEIYKHIAEPYWFKIYTTNVDNVLEFGFRSKRKDVDNLAFPTDEYKERDFSLEKTQIIYLNGKLPCNPEDLIFSTNQYAKSSIEHQPLYWHFVHEYSSKPTIFIGTSLNEPLLDQYIQARQKKTVQNEFRPKSFLISPGISPVQEELLKTQFNVHFIKGDTEAFLMWLKNISNSLLSKEEILLNVYPSLPQVSNLINKNIISHKYLNEFASSLKPVLRDYKIKEERSGFLLGNTPRWNDIYRSLDAHRDINDDIQSFVESELENNNELRFLSVLGSGGSGKSTILKRVALSLALEGRTVFLSNSEFLPHPDTIAEVLSSIKSRSVIIFDNAENIFSQIPYLLETLQVLQNPPIVLIATRLNTFEKLSSRISAIINVKTFLIPNLNRQEIINILQVLEANNLLDRLRGLTPEQRIKEFEFKAKKQILIAMREATRGMSFDEIIRSEYTGIDDKEAKLICLCISLITELGFTVAEQDIIGFSRVDSSTTLNHLNRTLAGVVLKVGALGDRYIIRHKVIAEFFTSHCDDIELLKDAYIRVLSVLGAELKNAGHNSRKFNLYRELINHQKLYRRFKEDINQARFIYDSISESFNYDSQFWLQYGSLEAEGKGGDFVLAENYLNQAESLDEKNHYIKNAKGSLLFKKAHKSSNISEALQLKKQAEEILYNTIRYYGDKNSYCYHILILGEYDWIRKFVIKKEEKNRELRELVKICTKAAEAHPRDRRLNELIGVVTKAYWNTGVKGDVDDPTYLDLGE